MKIMMTMEPDREAMRILVWACVRDIVDLCEVLCKASRVGRDLGHLVGMAVVGVEW